MQSKKDIPILQEDLDFTLDRIVAKTYKEIGPFNYSKLVKEEIIDKSKKRDMKGPSIMSDGSKYTGQFFKKTTVKDGIGQIIYKDGSLFEGVFRFNDTVKGRYITTKGYVYEGEMKKS